MSFDDFVCGEEGSLAHSAALAVADKMGVYNPLFIHGKTGTGKTHLLKAIEERAGSRAPGLPEQKVMYLRGDVMVSQIATAIKAGELDVWREDMRKLDYLLVDDIHVLIDKEKCTEEFFNLFEALHAQGKQIVISADCKPVEIQGIPDKLISRFSWGVVAQTPALTYSMAEEFLDAEAKKHNLKLRPEDTHWVLERIPHTPRELQGVAVQIAAHVNLSGKPLDAGIIHKALGNVIKFEPKVRRIAVDDIIDLVCEHYNVRMQAMMSPRRTKNLAFPRHVAMYLAKELTELTLTEIGGIFGGRDHSTVLHAINKIKGMRLKDGDLKRELDSMAESLTFAQTA